MESLNYLFSYFVKYKIDCSSNDSEKINVNDLAYIVILIGGHMRNTDLCLLASNSVLQSKS